MHCCHHLMLLSLPQTHCHLVDSVFCRHRCKIQTGIKKWEQWLEGCVNEQRKDKWGRGSPNACSLWTKQNIRQSEGNAREVRKPIYSLAFLVEWRGRCSTHSPPNLRSFLCLQVQKLGRCNVGFHPRLWVQALTKLCLFNHTDPEISPCPCRRTHVPLMTLPKDTSQASLRTIRDQFQGVPGRGLNLNALSYDRQSSTSGTSQEMILDRLF